jgi:FemAB family protein
MDRDGITTTDVAALAAELGLDARPRSVALSDWRRLGSGAPVVYSISCVDYQLCWLRGISDVVLDWSLALYHEKKPVAIWPLSSRLQNGNWILGSNEGGVLPPYFVPGLSEKTEKNLVARSLELLNRLAQLLGLSHWQGREIIGPAGAGAWHRRVMEAGAEVALRHELFVDLSWPLQAIRSNFRKSYKPLITAAGKLWKAEAHDTVSQTLLDEFRLLHQEVAGRVTRSLETWQCQMAGIQAGEAFLVTLRDNSDRLVGCGFFYSTAGHVDYAVGAYDRSLFDKPVGHLVQWKAIEHMKRLGAVWYRIGERPYPGVAPGVSEKELNIARFKEGFATHVFLRAETRCPVNGYGNDSE